VFVIEQFSEGEGGMMRRGYWGRPLGEQKKSQLWKREAFSHGGRVVRYKSVVKYLL